MDVRQVDEEARVRRHQHAGVVVVSRRAITWKFSEARALTAWRLWSAMRAAWRVTETLVVDLPVRHATRSAEPSHSASAARTQQKVSGRIITW